MDEAKERIEELLKEDVEHTLEFGAIYQSTIVELKDFGVLVQLFPGMPPALVHLTQLDSRKVGMNFCKIAHVRCILEWDLSGHYDPFKM